MTTPILYTQNGCAESKQTREWLAKHDIGFIERNVSGDLEAAMALVAAGLFATPLLVVNGDQVLGFRPDKIAVILRVDLKE